METTVIKFRVDRHVYVISTEYIQQIFYVKQITPMLHMPEYVIGSIQHGSSHYLLLCLKKILNIGECDEVSNKPVLLLSFNNNKYAFLIDEILALEEFTQNSSTVGDLYEKNDVVFQELPLQHVLQSITMPPLQQTEQKKIIKQQKEQFRPFLLFTLYDKLYAIDNHFIHSIVPLSHMKAVQQLQHDWITGIYNYKNRALKVADLAKKLHSNSLKEGSVIILQHDSKMLGLLIERIEGLVDIERDNIVSESDTNQLFEGYFHYQNSIIPIISSQFLQKNIDNYGLTTQEKEEQLNKEQNEEDLLLFSLFHEDYAIPIKNVVTVLEFSKTNITNNALTTNKNIYGLILHKNKTYYLIDIAKILQKELIPNDESKIIIIKNDVGEEFAIIVDNIKDIVSVPSSNIAHLSNTTSLSAGIVTLKNNSLNLFNTGWSSFH
ncbi:MULTISPECIES: chemotaxis protein CheW [unclassified Nitratiruptor]|uniref:chemotaxis protein CheW n=1 Tax=unclassified Nitratiruptor TaxID=2624044 RepID=UPI001915689E|nr:MULTISPECIES: chemotaxis protein CheW [unclassified Nitratiruptor]BCD59544.1 hypothetical protein NitYY0810_C0294 [Nitratiruptor sp. YY08-10]BCD63468.1 hypothetical protein NitYY0814_C0294 [Nitratiruptor sp. YY08-14]